MTDDAGVTVGSWSDAISLGVLTSSIPRDVVDEAVAVTGVGARRSDGKLPPHVMVYYTLALALFADEDYEGVASRLAGTLGSWGCWDRDWEIPTSGGITQARRRLGDGPLRRVFAQVAAPVAEPLTRGAFVGGRRLMSLDGCEWDAPATDANATEFGHSTGQRGESAFAKVRVVSISECGSHATVDAAIGGRVGKGSGEQTLARQLYPRLEPDWLLLADRNFYSFHDWQSAAATGAGLLWRVKANLRLPVLQTLADGSYLSVLTTPAARRRTARQQLVDTAQQGRPLDPEQATLVRVIEYQVPDRDGNGAGETIRLITTILDPREGPAEELAQAYHQRWEHEIGNSQLKTHLRGPGRVLRSKHPDTVRAEIYGYLLTHHAISALICQAATEADIDPDRVRFVRTVRLIRRSLDTGPAAFSP